MWKFCSYIRNENRTAIELYHDGMTLKTKQTKKRSDTNDKIRAAQPNPRKISAEIHLNTSVNKGQVESSSTEINIWQYWR